MIQIERKFHICPNCEQKCRSVARHLRRSCTALPKTLNSFRKKRLDAEIAEIKAKRGGIPSV